MSLGMSLDWFQRHVQPELRLIRRGKLLLVPLLSWSAGRTTTPSQCSGVPDELDVRRRRQLASAHVNVDQLPVEGGRPLQLHPSYQAQAYDVPSTGSQGAGAAPPT